MTGGDEGRRVIVTLSLYKPDLRLLERQIASLAAQTYRKLEVVICADGPLEPAVRNHLSGLRNLRVALVEPKEQIGAHGNFARGLREALSRSRDTSDLFAFCDQDDVWHPCKVERQVACLSEAGVSLCHSDARIVSDAGETLAPSLFDHEARSRSTSFTDLLVMNSVTGMTAMFRRDVAEAASAFPLSRCRYVLHDHWVALVAALLGRIRLIDEPLVDYTQHDANVLGARRWDRRLRRRRDRRQRRLYARRCLRQFLWRRRALSELRRQFRDMPPVMAQLSALPLRLLFDCATSNAGGLALSLLFRLRGDQRQADQVWRLVRGKIAYCSLRPKKSRTIAR